MAEQKRFKKRVLNKDDHKATENGAKVVKGIAGVFGAIERAKESDGENT